MSEEFIKVLNVEITENSTLESNVKLDVYVDAVKELPGDFNIEIELTNCEEQQALPIIFKSDSGPLPKGEQKISLEVNVPVVSTDSANYVVASRVLLLRCKYNEQEFMTSKWLINEKYENDEHTKKSTDSKQRSLKIDIGSRIDTHSEIDWENLKRVQLLQDIVPVDEETKRQIAARGGLAQKRHAFRVSKEDARRLGIPQDEDDEQAFGENAADSGASAGSGPSDDEDEGGVTV